MLCEVVAAVMGALSTRQRLGAVLILVTTQIFMPVLLPAALLIAVTHLFGNIAPVVMVVVVQVKQLAALTTLSVSAQMKSLASPAKSGAIQFVMV